MWLATLLLLSVFLSANVLGSLEDILVVFYTENNVAPFYKHTNESNLLIIDDLDETDSSASSIKKIVIEDQNRLQVLVEDSFKDLPRLKTLSIKHNSLKTIQPGAFKNLPILHKLDLMNNKLVEVPTGVFNYLHVEVLMLAENLISKISPSAFDEMPKLHTIFLSDNQITSWDTNWFTHSPKVSVVGLSNNLIEALPPGAFSNIQGRDSNDGIQIFLNMNKIKAISRAIFGQLKEIRRLTIKNNEIEKWDEDLFEGVKIGHFNIANNKLKCLKGDLGRFFVAPETYIDDNPWECDCIKGIVEWVGKNLKVDRFLWSLYLDSMHHQCKTGPYSNWA